jgi:hypothetical protein
LKAPAREQNPIWSVTCADRRHQGCQYGGPGTSVRRRFSGSSRQAVACQYLNTWGVWNVKHNGGLRHFADGEAVSLMLASSPIFSGPEAAATPAEIRGKGF